MKKSDQKLLMWGVGGLGLALVAFKASSGGFLPENKLIASNTWHFPAGAIPYATLFGKYQRMYKLPKYMLEAIAERESNFDVEAEGRNSEIGMMQIKVPMHPDDKYDGEFNTSWTRWTSEPINFKFAPQAIEYAGWYLRHIMTLLQAYELENMKLKGEVANWANVLYSYNQGVYGFMKYLDGKAMLNEDGINYANAIAEKIGIAWFVPYQ